MVEEIRTESYVRLGFCAYNFFTYGTNCVIETVFINYFPNKHKIIKIKFKSCKIFKILEFKGI